MASLHDLTRDELEAYARDVGIEDPSSYPNMPSLREAIQKKDQPVTDPGPTASLGGNVSDATEGQNLEPQRDDSADAQTLKGDTQERMDQEQEQGFVGIKADPTPNESYSLEGGEPQPGDNPTAPSEEQVKADPRLGDQIPGQRTYTEGGPDLTQQTR